MPIKTVSDRHKTTKNLLPENQFWEDFKIVVQPYWYPTDPQGRAFAEVMRSWGMVALLIFLIVAMVAVDAAGSFWNRYVLDIVIEERDLSKYLDTLWISCILLVAITLLVGFSKFVRKKISLDWYKWLSKHIFQKYLSDRAYYKVNFQAATVDNPDQRLAQEIEPITSIGLRFLATLLEKSLEMTAFLIIIWTISEQIAIYLIIYTIVGNLIAIFLTQELNKINQEELEFKADYSYGLTHVRNHAESIAFFQGEEQESKIIERRFSNVLGSAERKVDWERGQDIFNRSYQSAITVFSMFVLTPLFLEDQIDYGEISQVSFACLMFSNAVGILISEWGTSSKVSSYIERLAKFSELLKNIIKRPEGISTIKTVEGKHLAFENVTLETPDHEKVIVEDLSLTVQPGSGLLIVGPSGRGKSSLLRAIAGLWEAGSGRLVRPPLEEMLFMPQRPYIILGTLREQLLYPETKRQLSDQEVAAVLQQVNLEHLLERINNFDLEMPWEDILSLGEQQRLAFARILVNRPHFTILDEATSALDLTNEANLYQQLQQTNTTFISVGHRESLFAYHQWVLELLDESRWQLVPIDDYRAQKINALNLSQPDSSTIDVSGEDVSREDVSREDISGDNEPPTQVDQSTVATIDRPSIPPANELTLPEATPNAIASPDTTEENEPPTQTDESVDETPPTSLAHDEIKLLCNYALSTIRNKASRGKPITTLDGSIYRYNKDRKVRKWELLTPVQE